MQGVVLKKLFSGVSKLEKIGEGHYGAIIDEDFTIAGKPNGGYLLALVDRAILSETSFGDVLSSNCTYLISPDPGPVEIDVTLYRSGRNFAQLGGQMTQGGQLCLVVTTVVTTFDPLAKPYWERDEQFQSVTPWDQCLSIPVQSPGGFKAAIMEQVDIRLDPNVKIYSENFPSGSGELRGWLRLPEGEDFDSVSLQYALDSFPPATFEIERSGWVPTLALNTYVRTRPAPGSLWIMQRANLIQGQLVDERCYAWDSSGALVGQATQIAGVRLGEYAIG